MLDALDFSIDFLPMELKQHLSAVADLYVERTGSKLSRVSSAVFGDGTKLHKVMKGQSDLTTKRYEAAMKWFADNWPKGVAWPKGAFRPKK